MNEQELLERIAALEAREASMARELEQRNREVTEALDTQTAMAASPWSRHGSTRHLFTEAGVENACLYVTEMQDGPCP